MLILNQGCYDTNTMHPLFFLISSWRWWCDSASLGLNQQQNGSCRSSDRKVHFAINIMKGFQLTFCFSQRRECRQPRRPPGEFSTSLGDSRPRSEDPRHSRYQWKCQNIINQISSILFSVTRGARLDMCDKEGSQAIHVAAMLGHTDILAYLVAKGQSVDTKDAAGRTPLMLGEQKQIILPNNHFCSLQLCTRVTAWRRCGCWWGWGRASPARTRGGGTRRCTGLWRGPGRGWWPPSWPRPQPPRPGTRPTFRVRAHWTSARASRDCLCPWPQRSGSPSRETRNWTTANTL